MIKKTIKELKKELDKFDDNDTWYAYEGEVTGIAINREGCKQQGFIYSYNSIHGEETETIEE